MLAWQRRVLERLGFGAALIEMLRRLMEDEMTNDQRAVHDAERALLARGFEATEDGLFRHPNGATVSILGDQE